MSSRLPWSAGCERMVDRDRIALYVRI